MFIESVEQIIIEYLIDLHCLQQDLNKINPPTTSSNGIPRPRASAKSKSENR
jgi:hypothetical protein